MISSSKQQQQQQQPPHHHHHPTTTTTNASKNSYFRFTKTDLETTERELLLQCEETKRGNEINAIRAVVAGGEREAIRSAVSLVGGFGDVVGRTTAAEGRARRDDGDDDDGRGGKGNEEDDEESFLAREGRMVLKMARQKENMDQFTFSRTTTTTRREEEEEENEENEIEKREERTEKLTEMNTESAKRTFELESRGWETEETVVAEEEEGEGDGAGKAREEEEMEERRTVFEEKEDGGEEEIRGAEDEEEDRTQKYGGTPTQTQTNNNEYNNNSVGQSRNDLFRASGIAGGETVDPQGTQRVEPSFAEEEEEGGGERATEPAPVTTIAATQDDLEEKEEEVVVVEEEEEEEEGESEDDEEIEIVGTQVFASEDEEEKEEEKDKEEDTQQRAHDAAHDVIEDTAAEAALDVALEDDEEGAGAPILATPADAPPAKNKQPPPLPPRRGNAGSVIPATELSVGTQNVSATAPSGNAHVATVKVVASAAENALRKQMETRKKQAFGIESVAPQSLNPNSSDVEMQTERSKEDRKEEQEEGDGDDYKNDDDDNEQKHNQSPDLAEYYSQRVNETDQEDEIEEDDDDDEEEDEIVYRSQLTQQDDEGGVLHRPKNVKFSMPVILGDGEMSSSEEEEEEEDDDDCRNARDGKEDEGEDFDDLEDDDDKEFGEEDKEDEEPRGRKRKSEISSHAMRASKRKRKPKKFFDDTQRQEEDVDIEEEEEEEEEEEAPQPPPFVPRGTTQIRRSARAATTTTQKTSPPASTSLTKKKKAAPPPPPASKTPTSTATFSSASKGQTWSNYLSGCPKCRYSSCNACRPMHVRAIDGDESAQQRVIKWNERREEKVASASRSLGQKAKASNVRMRRTSSVHAAARTISMSLTPIKQTSTATKSRKSATDKRRKSTQSVQQSRRRNSVEDSAEKRKSITGGGGGGKTTALFSGLSFMITSMPSSRVMNEMRASITENGGRLFDSIPKFSSSKRVPARKQIVVLPTMNNNSEKRKETAKCLYARAIGARLRSVRWVRESLEKNRIMENDGQNATQPTKLNFQGTSFLLLGNTFFQDEFSNLMLHAGANTVMTCGKMTKKALNQALKRAQEEQNEIHAVVIQSSEKLSREIKSALSESRKIVVRHDWLTESLQRGEILEFLEYEVHL